MIDKKYTKLFIETMSEEFEYLILSGKKDWNFDVSSWAQEDYDIYKKFVGFNINRFYSKKRTELIKKVCRISSKQPELCIDTLANNLNAAFKYQIHLFELTPSFIIQYAKYACDNSALDSKNAKIFGEVYQASLTKLIERSVGKENVGANISVLSRLAYSIHFTEIYPISTTELSHIVEEYNKDFSQEINPKAFLKSMVHAKILRESETDFGISFCSTSQLAYFVAKELIRRHINENDQASIPKILDNLCFGINGDIMMFVSYLTSSVNILYTIYDYASDFMADWDEYDIDKTSFSFLDKIGNDLSVPVPTETDKTEMEAAKVQAEKDSESNQLIKVNDLYDYDKNDIDKYFNRILKAFKYTQIVAKILPSFDHEIRADKKDQFVDAVYRYPNKIVFGVLKSIDEDFQSVNRELTDMIHESTGETDETKLSKQANLILLDFVTGLMPSIYNSIAEISTTRKTIKYYDNYHYQLNSNYELQNIMMHESLSEHSEFKDRIIKFHTNCKSGLTGIIIRKVVRAYLMTLEKIHSSEWQRLTSSIFSKDDQPGLLISKYKSKMQ